MNIKNLKNISISNLILIILNDKNKDHLRKYAEIELRKRIKHVCCDLDDIMHFDDKIIQQRGLDINNYLISPNVNMQQLMETYFTYKCHTDKRTDNLLFSEKNLCNNLDFGNSFFSKVCNKEIKNLDKRLKSTSTYTQKENLLVFKKLLEERKDNLTQSKKELLHDDPTELLCHSDIMGQLETNTGGCCEFFQNCSDEETYKLLSTNTGMLKWMILSAINDTLLDPDAAQYLCGLHFVRKDSSKLSSQKRQLLSQARGGFEVDYETEQMRKVLQRIKK